MNPDLDNLEDKIDKARDTNDQKIEKEGAIPGGVRAGAEFISPMMGGLLLGYFLDKWLGTAPTFIISLFLLGVAGGFISIYRASLTQDDQVPFLRLHKLQKDVKTSVKDEEQE